MTENETVSKVMAKQKKPYTETIGQIREYLTKECKRCNHIEHNINTAIESIQKLKQFGITGFCSVFLYNCVNPSASMQNLHSNNASQQVKINKFLRMLLDEHIIQHAVSNAYIEITEQTHTKDIHGNFLPNVIRMVKSNRNHKFTWYSIV